MQVRLPKQDRATIKVAFKCGVEVRIILVYDSNINEYDLLIAYDPDNEKTGYRMKYLYDVCKEGRYWLVHGSECYETTANGQRYDVYAYVAENDDSYDIRIELHEVIVHEQ